MNYLLQFQCTEKELIEYLNNKCDEYDLKKIEAVVYFLKKYRLIDDVRTLRNFVQGYLHKGNRFIGTKLSQRQFHSADLTKIWDEIPNEFDRAFTEATIKLNELNIGLCDLTRLAIKRFLVGRQFSSAVINQVITQLSTSCLLESAQCVDLTEFKSAS